MSKLKLITNRKANEAGVSVIEFAVGIILLISIINGLWAMHSLHDMKRNIYSALYNAFTQSNIRPFTLDANDQFAPWPSLIVNQFLLTEVNTNIINATTAGSQLSAIAPVSNCRAVIGYLDVGISGAKAGMGLGTFTISSDPDVMASNAPVDQLIDTAANNYANEMNDKKINAEESRILLDADTLPTLGGNAGLPVTAIYLPYAPFFAWACEGKASILFNLVPFQNFAHSGVFNILR